MKEILRRIKICYQEFQGGTNINLRCAPWYKKLGFIYGILFLEISNWDYQRRTKKKERLRNKYHNKIGQPSLITRLRALKNKIKL